MMIIQLLVIYLAVGAVAGVLAGLMGVGGGIVIVPALYLTLGSLDMAPERIMQMAVGTSLATIVFTAASSASGHAKRGAIDWALLKIWAPSILVGVVFGGILGGLVSGRFLMIVFCTVALAVSADMLLRQASETTTPRSHSKPVWAGLGLFAGAVSAMMGIGGGTVCVPILSLLGYDIRKAVGTSAAIGLIIALPGTVMYIITGWNVTGLPPFSLGYVNLLAAAILVPMTVLGARMGVRIAHYISPVALRRVFGLFLALTALRMARDLIAGISGA